MTQGEPGPAGVTRSAPVRVAVVGCGAIGSLYAGHLARVPGVEVWTVDPWSEHVDAMEANGLRVTGLVDFTAQVHARTDGRQLPTCDFGVVATKALHTRAAVAGAQAALAEAAVVSVQNGLGNEEVIAELVPRVIRGSIVTAGAIVAPGVVRYDAPGGSWFGPFEPRPAPMSAVGQLAAVGSRVHPRGEVREPGDPQPVRLHRVHVLRPRVDGPHLDAGHPGEMPGVQAADRAAADDRDADRVAAFGDAGRDGVALGHDAARAVLAISSQMDGPAPPTPRPATTRPPSRTGRPPATPSTGGTTSAARASAAPNRSPRPALS